MDLCKTDTRKIIYLLTQSAQIITKYASLPKEIDISRQCRNMAKKISKKG